MKKIIGFFLIFGLVRVAAAESELLLKGGYSVSGKLKIENESLCSGGDCFEIPDDSNDVNNGLSVSMEYNQFTGPRIALGAGVTYQLPRTASGIDGKFNFLPFYGVLKLRSVPDGFNNYFYALGQLGYAVFLGDKEFKGDGGSLTGGLHYGFGAGYAYNQLVLELLYTQDQGRAESQSCIPLTFGCSEAKADMKYSALTFNIGIRWSGTNASSQENERKRPTPSANAQVLESFHDVKKDDRVSISLKDGRHFEGTFVQWDYNDPDKFWLKVDGDMKGRTRPFYLSDLARSEKRASR